MSPASKVEEHGPVELRLFTFIPLSRVADPFGVEYKADGPGFSYQRIEFRTRHMLIIDPSKGWRPIGGAVEVEPDRPRCRAVF